MLREKVIAYNKRHPDEFPDGCKELLKKWCYYDYLDSNKPLTLEQWFTKEEIDKLES